MPDRITSPSNPRIKALARLRDGTHRRKEGHFLIEGQRELARAIAAGVRPLEVFLSDTARTRLGELPSELAPFPLTPVADAAFARLSHRESPDGILGLARLPQFPLRALRTFRPAPLILLIEAIEKPGNLGTLFRTADAAGVDAILLTGAVTDPCNPNAIRTSQGAVFSVPCALCSNDEARLWLRERGISSVATTPAATRAHWDASLAAPTALLLGSEKDGLSDFWLSPETTQVRIPMRGQADSLNVSAAAAIVLFEALRQRLQVSHPSA